jgi:hypothetical protein
MPLLIPIIIIRKKLKGGIFMMRNIDEIVKQIGSELHIDPLKAKYMAKAYDIPKVRTDFMDKYSRELDGKNPLLVFCEKCLDDKDLREEAYYWMNVIEGVGRGRLMFSIQ